MLQLLTGLVISDPVEVSDYFSVLQGDSDVEDQLNYPLLRPYLLRSNLLSDQRLVASGGDNSLRELSERYPFLSSDEMLNPSEYNLYRDLVSLAVENWSDETIRLLAESPVFEAVFTRLVEEGRFDPDQHRDWVINNPQFYEFTLIPWIERGELDTIVGIWGIGSELDEETIKDAVFRYGSLDFIREYMGGTDNSIPSLHTLVTNGRLEVLRYVLETIDFDQLEVEEALEELQDEPPMLIGDEVLQIFMNAGYDVDTVAE